MRRQKIACNAELILVILRDPSGPLYNLVKRFGDITDGIVTQCVASTASYSARNELKTSVCAEMVA